MKEFYKKHQAICSFVLRTVFYFIIILALIYLYRYHNIQGGTFIYNEF